MKKESPGFAGKEDYIRDGRHLILRPLQPEDCCQAADLLAACFADPWSREALEEACRQEAYIQTGAFLQSGLIGYAGLKMVLDEADVTNICVHPDRRLSGIGKALLGQLLSMAEDRGIGRIYLEVRASNQAAIHMYREAGFKETGKRRGFYERPKEDALLMMRDQTC